MKKSKQIEERIQDLEIEVKEKINHLKELKRRLEFYEDKYLGKTIRIIEYNSNFFRIVPTGKIEGKVKKIGSDKYETIYLEGTWELNKYGKIPVIVDDLYHPDRVEKIEVID